MKKIVVSAIMLSLLSSAAHAGLTVIGKGDAMHFDPSSYPAKMKENYTIMKVRCVKCHTLERTVVAITTGIAPISGQLFDRNATKAYGIKMMRKPDSNMNKQEVKAVVELMNWMLGETSK